MGKAPSYECMWGLIFFLLKYNGMTSNLLLTRRAFSCFQIEGRYLFNNLDKALECIVPRYVITGSVILKHRWKRGRIRMEKLSTPFDLEDAFVRYKLTHNSIDYIVCICTEKTVIHRLPNLFYAEIIPNK